MLFLLLPGLFSSCSAWGYSLVEASGLLIAVAALIVEHGLRSEGFSSCGSQALEHRLNSCGTRV